MRPAILTVGLISLLLAVPAVASGARVTPESTEPWLVEGAAFEQPDARTAYSGFACAPLHPDYCVLAVDEGRQAAFVSLHEGRLQRSEMLDLAPEIKEADAEAVAADERYFYVAGSHAVKRSDCAPNPASRFVYRIAHGAGARQGEFEKARLNLGDVFQQFDALKPYAAADACLGVSTPEKAPLKKGMNGIDIEAVAASNGRLFFGLRGPSLCGVAYIVSVDAAALFSGDAANLHPAIFPVAVGEKRGFRDLTVAQGEVLALVGPDDDSLNLDYSIYELKGLAQGKIREARELALLDLSDVPEKKKAKPLKPEALVVLSTNPARYRMLILSDGGTDGAPLVFNIPR